MFACPCYETYPARLLFGIVLTSNHVLVSWSNLCLDSKPEDSKPSMTHFFSFLVLMHGQQKTHGAILVLENKKLSHHLKDVRSFIKIDRCKEDFVSKGRGITPGVSQHLELLISLSEKRRRI